MSADVYAELKAVENRINERKRRMLDQKRQQGPKTLNVKLDLHPFRKDARNAMRETHEFLFGETPKRSIMDKIMGRNEDIAVLHIPTGMHAQGDFLFFVFPTNATYKSNDILGVPEFSIEDKRLIRIKHAMSSFPVDDKTMPSQKPVAVHTHSNTAVLFHKHVKVFVEFK